MSVLESNHEAARREASAGQHRRLKCFLISFPIDQAAELILLVTHDH